MSKKSPHLNTLLASLVTLAALVVGGVGLAAPANAASTVTPVNPLTAVANVGGLGTQQAIPTIAAQSANAAPQSSAPRYEQLGIAPFDSSIATVTHTAHGGLPATEFSGAQSHSYVVGTSPLGTPAAFAVINSASSPDTFNFHISASTGPIALDKPVDGMIAVRGVSGTVVNILAPAWAIDATGKSLPTNYTVAGDVVTQHVDLTGAVFPVVADPSLACNLFFCTEEFNKADTKNAADYSSDAGALILIGCAAGGPVTAGICAVAVVAVHSTAVAAVNAHKCLGIRNTNFGGPYYPVVYSGSYCK